MSTALASSAPGRWTTGLRGLLLQRLFQAGLVAWMVGTLTFVLTRTLPGDMAYRIAAGRYGHDMVNTAAAEAVRAELALDQPALTAYFGWLWDLVQFDLGRSLVSGAPVVHELWHQLGHSLGLAASAVLLSLLLLTATYHSQLGVQVVGGCCGTTPDHVRAIAQKLRNIPPREIPRLAPATRLSGLEPLKIEGNPAPFIMVGERTNVTGSPKFAQLIKADDFESALEQANDTKFGLQVGVFTNDVNRVFKAVKRLNFGGVIINDTPNFRADHMPYGGNRQSGLGREGVRFAMEDMTNIQMVAIRLNS